jgi:hypothetical protein
MRTQQNEPETSWLDAPFEQWVIETPAGLAAKVSATQSERPGAEGALPHVTSEYSRVRILADADATGD